LHQPRHDHEHDAFSDPGGREATASLSQLISRDASSSGFQFVSASFAALKRVRGIPLSSQRTATLGAPFFLGWPPKRRASREASDDSLQTVTETTRTLHERDTNSCGLI